MKAFESRLLQALVAEDRPEAMINAVKFSEPDSGYETIFSDVMEMENKNYIKLVYCQAPAIINVQLTLVGLAVIQNEKL